ncbi:MAG: hypothetical protein ACI9V1_003214, partial [Spirosomataceae bacterium]
GEGEIFLKFVENKAVNRLRQRSTKSIYSL